MEESNGIEYARSILKSANDNPSAGTKKGAVYEEVLATCSEEIKERYLPGYTSGSVIHYTKGRPPMAVVTKTEEQITKPKPTRKPRVPAAVKAAHDLMEALTGGQDDHPRRVAGIPMHKCWQDAISAIEAGVYRVLLFGIPGTGKTLAGNETKFKGKTPEVYNIYLGEESSAYQIVGTDSLEKGNMVWRDGPAMKQRRNGGRLIINEIDHASGDALDALIWICDDPRTAAKGVDLPTGETVFPHEDLQFIGTMNGRPEDLGDALSDRFKTQFEITCPHPEAIMSLPVQLWDIAVALTGAETPESQRISIRQFRSFTEMIELGVNPDTAARGAFHHRADELLKTIRLAAASN